MLESLECQFTRMGLAQWPLLLSVLLLATHSKAQFGMGKPPGPEAQAVRSDLKYIRCEVCEQLAKQAYRQVSAFKKEAAEKQMKHERKVKELDLLEKIEKMTNPLKDEGEWLTRLDLVEQGSKLTLKEMPDQGKCGPECKTIQSAAEAIIESADTDMAEKLWQGKLTRAQFTKWLCKEATSSCKQKPPPLPKDRPVGPAFEAVDPEEIKMQKMMAQMKEMGMGGQVYDRQQAQRMAKSGMEDEDDYDEDDDPLLPTTPSDLLGKEAEETSSKAASTVQATVEGAVNAAKKAGQGLLSKAQSLLGGSPTAETSPDAEL